MTVISSGLTTPQLQGASKTPAFNSANKSQSVDDIQFSGLFRRKYEPDDVTLDYQAIDPLLTPEEVASYEASETQWREMMEGMSPKTLKILEARIQNQENLTLKKSFLGGGTLGASNPSHDNSSIKIITNRLQKKNERFKSLGHELAHALHFEFEGHGQDSPSKLRSFFEWGAAKLSPTSLEEMEYEAVYDSILKVVNQRSVFLNKRKPKHFKKALRDAIDIAPVSVLRRIKGDFISEVVAHSLQSTLSESRKEQKDLLATSEGFKVAVELINERLTAKHPEKTSEPKTEK